MSEPPSSGPIAVDDATNPIVAAGYDVSEAASVVIEETWEDIEPDELLDLVKSHILPVIDALPFAQSSQIAAAFAQASLDAQKSLALLNSIEFSEHLEDFNERFRKLEKSIRRDYHDGYEDQTEMMQEIVQEVVDWMEILFHVGVENQSHLEEVVRSLKLVNETVNKVYRTHGRIPYKDVDDYHEFTSIASKKVLYSSYNVRDIVAKFSRDLICTAIVKNHGALAKATIDYAQRSGYQEALLEVVRDSDEDPNLEQKDEDAPKYDDAWYSPEMKAALFRIVPLCHATDLNAFKTRPSLELYHRIVRGTPSLKSNLLRIIKNRLEGEPTKVDYLLALKIYEDEPETAPLVALIDKIGSHHAGVQWAQKACSDAILKLARSSPESRALALPLLRAELLSARGRIMRELYETVPDLDDIVSEVFDVLGRKGIPERGGTRQQATAREQRIERILEESIRPDDNDEERFNGMMENMDENDSDYEGFMNDMQPDLAGNLEYWQGILKLWPDEAERAELASKLRPQGDEDGLFTIEGLGDMVTYSLPSHKDHVAEGFRALLNPRQ